jgi:hypothetical protein
MPSEPSGLLSKFPFLGAKTTITIGKSQAVFRGEGLG